MATKRFQVLLKDITALTKARLLAPEQMICEKLLSFEKEIPKKLTDKQFEQVEGVFIELLDVNNGGLSIQCCTRIADCLLCLYHEERKIKIWNFITVLTKKPKKSVIFAGAHILGKIGKYSKSVIPGVVQAMISQKDDLVFPVLYCLNVCFKVSLQDCMKHAEKAFQLAKKHIIIPNEPVQLLCLKLLRKILKTKLITMDKYLILMHQILEEQSLPFIIKDACYLIAKCAASLVDTTKEEPEEAETAFVKAQPTQANTRKRSNSLSRKPMSSISIAFATICQFKNHFADILERFLSLFEPQFIHANRTELFELIRSVDPKVTTQLISLLGTDVKKELFSVVAKQQPPTPTQLMLLQNLSLDYNTLSEAAALAMQLASKRDNKTRARGAEFFSSLVFKDPELASLFLKTSTLFLANPPENNPSAQSDMRGMAMIAASILASAPNAKNLIEVVKENLDTFINNSYKITAVAHDSYQPLFCLLTTLPDSFYDNSKIDKLLSMFLEKIEKPEPYSEEEASVLVTAGEAIANFFSVHSNFAQTLPIINTLLTRPSILTDVVELGIYLAFSHLKAEDKDKIRIAEKLKTFILKNIPEQEYTQSRLASLFITRTHLLHRFTYKPPPAYAIFVHCSKSETAYRVITKFPEFMVAIPQAEKNSWIQWLVLNTSKPAVTHNLILSLILNEKTQKLLPKNLHEIIMQTMPTWQRTDHIQLGAEVIARWAKIFPGIVPSILETLDPQKDRCKCFILAAIFAHATLSDSDIISQLLNLNELALSSNDLTPYALFALSSLCLNYSLQLAAIPITDGQTNFIYNMIMTNRSIDAFNLFYLSYYFTALIPILTPNIESSRPQSIPMIKLVIQAIADTHLPFCAQVFYHMMHAVFRFAKQFSSTVQMHFPSSPGYTLSCQVEACGAFADMLVITSNQVDYFYLIPHILLLLQRTEHEYPAQFIVAIAASFASNAKSIASNPPIRERLVQWTRLIKLVLAAGSLPGTGTAKIGASNIVRKCMLDVIVVILPLVPISEPLLTESLDDIMTSVTRSIESRNPSLQSTAFQIAATVFDLFKDMESDAGTRILELYDMQFSTAVKYAFFSLTMSGDFMLKYLQFHLDSFTKRPDDVMAVLTVFVNGMKECTEKDPTYYAISAHLCMIATHVDIVYEKIKPFLKTYVTEFSEIIFEAVNLWTDEKPDVQAITNFRLHYSSFFKELLVSFIWIQTILKIEIIKPRQFATFLIDEISNTKNEIWRITAAFDALSACLKYTGKAISNRMLIKAVGSIFDAYQINAEILKPNMKNFLIKSSERIDTENIEAYNQLISLLVDDNFDPTVLCYLIKNGAGDVMSDYADNFLNLIFEAYKHKECTEDQAISLCVMLFYCANDHLRSFLRFVLGIKDRKHNKMIVRFKILFISKIISFCTDDTIIQKYSSKITELAWTNFNEGGMDLAVLIMNTYPEIGLELLNSELVAGYTEMILDDTSMINAFVPFVIFVLNKFDPLEVNMDEFINNIIKFSLRAIIQWSEDRLNGKPVMTNASQILHIIATTSEPLIRISFKAMDQEFQDQAIKAAERIIAKTLPSKTGANLQFFGTSKSRRRKANFDDSTDDSEWQEMEVS